MSVIVINNTNFKLSQNYYRNFLRRALKELKLPNYASLIFVDNVTIKKYNKEYRKKNKPTDILTFTYDDEHYAGDIIISYEWVRREYSKETIKENMSKLILHGLLHLKGIHHSYTPNSLKRNWEKMDKIYKEILKKKKSYETEN